MRISSLVGVGCSGVPWSLALTVALTPALAPIAGAQATAPAAVRSASAAAPTASAPLARYVGAYTLTDSAGGGATPLRVFVQDGRLVGQLRTNAPTSLDAVGPDTFRPAADSTFAVTFAVKDGRATRVTLRGPGVRLQGPRNDPRDDARPRSQPVDAVPGDTLARALARQDSLLFDAAYVSCDAARVNAMLARDVEFYHDLTGFHAGDQVREDFRRLTANCPRAQGITRVLVPGSLQVYPIHAYGAVQTGEHRFVRRDGSPSGGARFVHLWHLDADGQWRLARVLSFYHHAETDERGPASGGR